MRSTSQTSNPTRVSAAVAPGGKALAVLRGADPVADLERIVTDPQVEAAPADLLRLVTREEPVHEVLAEVELAPEAAQELGLLLECRRLLERPRHPRHQVVDARVDRVFEQRRVARLVAADDHPLGYDPVRRRPLQNSSSFRTASTTRSTDGMYASSICQYGYGTS